MKHKLKMLTLACAMLCSSLVTINHQEVHAKSIATPQQKAKLVKIRHKYITIEQIRKKKLEELKEEVKQSKKIIKKQEQKYKDMYIPKHSTFKSYMPYQKITVRSSKQYKLQKKAHTDKNGLRKIGKYYLVAMGQYYGKVGDKFKITLSSGQVFYAMMGDAKQFKHTGNTKGMVGADNKDMLEFIVDKNHLNSKIKKMGSVDVILHGKIVKLQKEI